MIRNLHNSREYALPRAKVFLFPTPRPNELLCNCTRIIGRDGRELNPLIVEDITEAEIEGRRQVREYARFFKDRLIGCENSFVNDTGVQVGVRQTRQIRGVETLTNKDVASGTKRKSSIARSAWPIELHSGEKPRLNGYSTTTMTLPTEILFLRRVRGFWWPAAAYLPSTKPWRPRASPRSASPTGRRSAWRLPCACAAGRRRVP